MRARSAKHSVLSAVVGGTLALSAVALVAIVLLLHRSGPAAESSEPAPARRGVPFELLASVGMLAPPVADAGEPAAAAPPALAVEQVEAVEPAGPPSQEGRGPGDEEQDEPPRPGIPVTNALMLGRCASCHAVDEEGRMSRVSYMRKTPEGWELSLKRMLRLYSLELTPEQAREVVSYLANDHGLSRSEAERAMYEVERRVHWSEADEDQDLRETCGECHTLGRVLSERRDAKEWKLLKATHLAFFPLADFQAFRGRGGGWEGIDWESMGQDEIEAEVERRRNQRGPDRADKVLEQLAKELPLETPEWSEWEVNRREVPLAGSWSVVGHEVSRGDVYGELRIERTGPDEYATVWRLRYEDGAVVQRTGKGLLYAGYSWRGRSETTAPREPESLREVLLVSEDWDRMRGRMFAGEYNELGVDVELFRRGAEPAIYAVDDGAVPLSSEGHALELVGANLPAELSAADFHLGEGVRVLSAERRSPERVRLTVAVDEDAPLGARTVSFRQHRGPKGVVLYDTIDYLDVRPGEGFSRVGGQMRARQLERFEAVAMNRGPDGEPWTEDDFAVEVVPARWSIEEFPIRVGDDDAQFVGEIDAATGVFTPALDGPNPARRWEANNIGDVYVVATATVEARERVAGEGDEPETLGPLGPMELRARGHLLVTVPIYVRWDRYEWDRR